MKEFELTRNMKMTLPEGWTVDDQPVKAHAKHSTYSYAIARAEHAAAHALDRITQDELRA
jgi:hypothetical protein